MLRIFNEDASYFLLKPRWLKSILRFFLLFKVQCRNNSAVKTITIFLFNDMQIPPSICSWQHHLSSGDFPACSYFPGRLAMCQGTCVLTGSLLADREQQGHADLKIKGPFGIAENAPLQARKVHFGV